MLNPEVLYILFLFPKPESYIFRSFSGFPWAGRAWEGVGGAGSRGLGSGVVLGSNLLVVVFAKA